MGATRSSSHVPAVLEAEPFVGYRMYPWPDVKQMG
jgi:hypothetical protein